MGKNPAPFKDQLNQLPGCIITLIIMGIIAMVANNGAKNVDAKYYAPGIAAFQKGDYTTAEADFRVLLHKYPEEIDYHYQLGMCLLYEGRKDEARSDFLYAAIYGGSRTIDTVHKAQAALTFMDQNPDWQPPSVAQPTPSATPGQVDPDDTQ